MTNKGFRKDTDTNRNGIIVKMERVCVFLLMVSLCGAVSLTELEVKFQNLEKENLDRKVAFSASLMVSGNDIIGPFPEDTTLIFKHVFSNFGNAYDPLTGMFTAPRKGVYHFMFYINSWADGLHTTGVTLMKNTEPFVSAHERAVFGHSNAANGVTLQLEPGDRVYLKLIKNSNIFDSFNHHSTFSGFMLFPMSPMSELV